MADQHGALLTDVPIKPTGSGPLDGRSIAVKDLLVTADGQPTTAGSNILRPFVSPYQATVIERILAAGGTIIGKSNLDEFAMGSSTETSAIAKTVNPWDPARVPGGSSGGSAVAVADGLADLAIGTDTGGSIRQPASLCGAVGVKPTYGRVSRYGVTALASSLDQVGAFGRRVADVATLLAVISGDDPHDATTVPEPVPDYRAALSGSVKGMKIGLPKEYFIDGLDPEVAAAVQTAADDLAAAGASLHDVSLPHTQYAIATYYVIMPAEASANLARYDGIRYGYSAATDPQQQPASLEEVYTLTRAHGFGPEAKRRVMLGTYVLSAGYYDAYYRKAMQVRTLIKRDFSEAFQQVDLILTPTTPTTAFPLGAKTDDPLQMYLNDIFTVTANLAGIPGLSLPCGFDSQGLPIGLQLLGPQWGEAAVLRAADVYEQRHDWHARRPGGDDG